MMELMRNAAMRAQRSNIFIFECTEISFEGLEVIKIYIFFRIMTLQFCGWVPAFWRNILHYLSEF